MRADVFLVLAHEQILDLRAAAEDDEEQAGGERIERAAMADLLRAETAADDGDDVVRGHAARLCRRGGRRRVGRFGHER